MASGSFNQRPDWHELVRSRAASGGVDLPQATVDELALHLDDLYAATLAAGGDHDAALARAMAALDESGFRVLRRHARRAPDSSQSASLNVMGSIRVAFRQFRQHPTFALVVVLVLGLGTGAATTVFTAVDAVVLRPLPFAEPDRLVTLWDTNAEQGLSHDPISPVNFMDYRALPVFEDAAAWWRPGINLVDPGMDPVRVRTIEVSGNLFDVLGVRPQIGAGFPQSGPLFMPNERIAVISDRLWRTRYSADPAIIGRQLTFNDSPYTVVGVMPPKFDFPGNVDVWQRLVWDMTRHSRAAHFMEAVARLADGTSFDEAQAAVTALGLRLQHEFRRTNAGWSSRLIPLLDEQLGYYRPALMVLFGAVGLLLLIGVLNVASLLLTRALSREREIAVRIAMGAAPRQLVTQLMAESLVLSLAGALLGIVAAGLLLPVLVSVTPVEIPRLEEAAVDWRALGLGLGVVTATTVFFGLVPSLLLLHGHLNTDLKSGERGSSRAARRTYSVLVAAEVAMACALLVSSALLVRTVQRMMDTPMGVEADTVLAASVQLAASVSSGSNYEGWQTAAETHTRIVEAIRQQPGVIAAGAANFLPLEAGWRNPFGLEGQPPPERPEDAPQAQMHSISEGYFEAMGARLLQGRSFTVFDGPRAQGVVIVNETFARRYLAGREGPVGRGLLSYSAGIGPLGRSLLHVNGHAEPIRFEIVGVVNDIRNVPLEQAVEPAIYFTTRQFPFMEQVLAVRATDAATARDAVRAALKATAPTVPMGVAQTWGDRFRSRTAEPRMLMTILTLFGALAALLAALGVYGLFSWSVALRTRELAIRLTLGARPAAVGGLVVRQSALLVLAGLVVGLVVVRTAEGALSRVLFEVSPSDMTSTLAASAVLVAAALVACIPPALRAMRVDPVVGLRAE
ncbi:MAG TPA: ADOP family duplicated permease [Vicinamibacterales bacterium]|nr:ADOP family duplicated permease [Vicinamibacterales bacterium]